MNKPIIGITPSIEPQSNDIKLRSTYQEAVKAAGGIPLILPLDLPKEDLLCLANLCQGFLFSGGDDIHPFLFGEDTHEKCKDLSPIRDQTEQDLLSIAMNQRKPVLGICRGIQIINVALGGDLYQDIPSQYTSDFPIAHRQPFHYTVPSHLVNVTRHSKLEQIAGCAAALAVNSMHHQAIRRPAPALTVSARSRDQLIEAVEMPDYPYLVAVQWHPEYLWPKDPAAKALFQSFVAACQKGL